MDSLRTGYTTGTCAAAAAKAATTILAGLHVGDRIVVDLPDGSRASLPLLYTRSQGKTVTAAVRKDAGDDPDVTDGAVIEATVSFKDSGEIAFHAGEGVGTVTKPGLQIAQGEPAINPVPRQMISAAVQSVVPKGVNVTISVPDGGKLAKQTFNPKLGIVGGISIIGTTGRVRPFSVPALREALKSALGIAAAAGIAYPVYVPGNIGKKAAKRQLALKEDQIIEVSNEWGYMLDRLGDYDFSKLLALGHPGKLAKLAAGYWDTHSSRSESALPYIAGIAEKELKRGIPDAGTVEGAFKKLDAEDKRLLGNALSGQIQIAIAERIAWSRKAVAVMLVDMKGDMLGEAGETEIWR